MSSPAPANDVEEVIADTSSEEWTFLDEDEAASEAEQSPAPITRPSTPCPPSSSDIEVIEHESDEETVLDESRASLPLQQLTGETSGRAMDWSFADDDGSLDLSPGPKAYIHLPNSSVNFWLNLSVLVAVTSVMGMGIGNYIGSYVNWPRHSSAPHTSPESHIELQQQLDDCIHDKEVLLNSSVFNTFRPPFGPESFEMRTSASGEEGRLRSEETKGKGTDSNPRVVLLTREPHLRQSIQVQASRDRQISSKAPVIAEEELRHRNRRDESHAADVTPGIWFTDADKSIVIETSTIISFRTKDYSKRRGSQVVESEVRLLLTEKGTSRPVFVSKDGNQKVVAPVFRPFLRNAFPDKKFVVWIEAESKTPEAKEWKGMRVTTSDQNPDWGRRRKVVKHFWSNLKKKVFKNWNGGDVSEFQSRLIEALLSTPESQLQQMFDKMREKMRRDAVKRSRRT